MTTASVPAGAKKLMKARPIIRLNVEENPKRLGSAAYERFAAYEDGMTVNDYFAKGGRPEDIRWDLEHHYIKLECFDYVKVTDGAADAAAVGERELSHVV